VVPKHEAHGRPRLRRQRRLQQATYPAMEDAEGQLVFCTELEDQLESLYVRASPRIDSPAGAHQGRWTATTPPLPSRRISTGRAATAGQR
jgi:hypothetical protein